MNSRKGGKRDRKDAAPAAGGQMDGAEGAGLARGLLATGSLFLHIHKAERGGPPKQA